MGLGQFNHGRGGQAFGIRRSAFGQSTSAQTDKGSKADGVG